MFCLTFRLWREVLLHAASWKTLNEGWNKWERKRRRGFLQGVYGITWFFPLHVKAARCFQGRCWSFLSSSPPSVYRSLSLKHIFSPSERNSTPLLFQGCPSSSLNVTLHSILSLSSVFSSIPPSADVRFIQFFKMFSVLWWPDADSSSPSNTKYLDGLNYPDSSSRPSMSSQ